MLEVLLRCQRLINTFQWHKLVNDGESMWELDAIPETFGSMAVKVSGLFTQKWFPIKVLMIQTSHMRWFRSASKQHQSTIEAFSLQKALQWKSQAFWLTLNNSCLQDTMIVEYVKHEIYTLHPSLVSLQIIKTTMKVVVSNLEWESECFFNAQGKWASYQHSFQVGKLKAKIKRLS